MISPKPCATTQVKQHLFTSLAWLSATVFPVRAAGDRLKVSVVHPDRHVVEQQAHPFLEKQLKDDYIILIFLMTNSLFSFLRSGCFHPEPPLAIRWIPGFMCSADRLSRSSGSGGPDGSSTSSTCQYIATVIGATLW
jgi:hypothetical protein